MKKRWSVSGRLINSANLSLFLGLVVVTAPSLRASSLTLTPGSLLIGQTAFPTGAIFEDTRAGVSIGNVNLPILGDIPESLTVQGGEVFVGDGSGRVSQINPATGSVIRFFSTPSIALDSLGNFNGNLIALPAYQPTGAAGNIVYVYSVSGNLLQSITLQTIPVNSAFHGLTSDGSIFYVADYKSGLLYEYSTAGTLLGSIDTHLGLGLSGLSYDSSNNSLWIADSTTSMAYDFSTSGLLLSEFATVITPAAGIAVVPGSVPEPSCFLLMLAGVAILGIGKMTRAKA